MKLDPRDRRAIIVGFAIILFFWALVAAFAVGLISLIVYGIVSLL